MSEKATAMRRAKAEAKAVLQEDGSALVPLAGEMVGVLPPGDWRSKEIEALEKNLFQPWARGCLTAEGFEIWDRVNPTLNQAEEFFRLWQNRTGQDVGESAAS